MRSCMQIVLTAVLGLAVASGCNTVRRQSDLAAGNSPGVGEETGYTIEALVTGDHNCPPWRPERLTLKIKSENSAVTSVSSASLKDLLVFTAAPFQPTEEEFRKLKEANDNRALLGDATYRASVATTAKEVFSRTYPTSFDTNVQLQYLRSANFLAIRIGHNLKIDDLLEYQAWLDAMIPKYQAIPVAVNFVDYSQYNLPPEFAKVGMPLLIYGSTNRIPLNPVDNGDQFQVTFKSSDTIITGGAQNEAHDTTLCQLRTGIVTANQKYDISLFRVLSVHRD